MKLKYMLWFHNTVFVLAVLGAMFCGMVMQYTINKAEKHAIEMAKEARKGGMIDAYLELTMLGLSEVKVHD